MCITIIYSVEREEEQGKNSLKKKKINLKLKLYDTFYVQKCLWATTTSIVPFYETCSIYFN